MKAGNYLIRWLYLHIPITTYCDIYNNEPHIPKLIATGSAGCHFRDHFCKEKGRKLSLARAMKNANLPKEERTVIWELYRNMKQGGRW
jgi:hypothetical protein